MTERIAILNLRIQEKKQPIQLEYTYLKLRSMWMSRVSKACFNEAKMQRTSTPAKFGVKHQKSGSLRTESHVTVTRIAGGKSQTMSELGPKVLNVDAIVYVPSGIKSCWDERLARQR
jgi:hypothetical protein